MSERKLPEINELKELTQLLLNLFETAARLPNGPERQTAFGEIDEFQRRLARLIRHSAS